MGTEVKQGKDYSGKGVEHLSLRSLSHRIFAKHIRRNLTIFLSITIILSYVVQSSGLFPDTNVAAENTMDIQEPMAPTGNLSEDSNHITFTYDGVQDMEAPVNLTYEPLTENSIRITWQKAMDESVVAGYEVFRNGISLGITEGPEYIDMDLDAKAVYSYTVIALDKADNRSVESQALTVCLSGESDTAKEEESIGEEEEPTLEEAEEIALTEEDTSLDQNYLDEMSGEFKTNRFIVKYKNKESGTKFKNYLKGNVKSTRKIKLKDNNAEIIVLNKKVKPEEFISEVKGGKHNKQANFSYESEIEYIQPDYQFLSSSVDPYYSEQWGIENTYSNKATADTEQQEENASTAEELTNSLDSSAIGVTDAIDSSTNTYKVDANVADAWQLSKGAGTIVAVIDTGVDITQEDLAENIWVNSGEIPGNGMDDDGNGFIDDMNGWDFVQKTNQIHSPDLINDEWHGTHVAGIIAAQDNNGLGITGVAPDACIMPLKVFQNGTAYTSDIIAAIEYAEAMGADIVNCSWGSSDNNPALEEVIRNSGMLFVCAAGNSHVNTDYNSVYPACYGYDNVISVAAVDSDGILTGFTNYGEYTVDVAAPGEDIISTYPGNTYISSNGTSMSAAFVSGEAALILGQSQELGSHDIKNKIVASSIHLSSLTGKIRNSNMISCLNAVMNVSNSDMIQITATDNNNYSDSLPVNEDYSLYAADPWTIKSYLPTSVFGSRAVTLNGKIYIIGTDNYVAKQAYEYDPITNISRKLPDMNYYHFYSSSGVAAVNGKIYAFGPDGVEEYNPVTNVWTVKNGIPSSGIGICVAAVNNLIYVMGGSSSGNSTNSVLIYNPATNTWSVSASMIMARYMAEATVVDGKIYVVGGYNNGTMEMYDPQTNSWSLKASLYGGARYCFEVETVNNKIYVLGGEGKYDVIEYSVSNNSWSTCVNVPNNQTRFSTAVYNNKIYVIGGIISATGKTLDSIYEFNPALLGAVTDYIYDANNRLKEIKVNNVTKVRFSYDNNGNLISVQIVN